MTLRSVTLLGVFFLATSVRAQSIAWQSVSGFTGNAREGAQMFAIGDTLYVMGGMPSSRTVDKDFYSYSIKAKTWKTIPAGPGLGRIFKRAFGVALTIGDKAYFGLGVNYDAPDSVLSDWWQFDPKTHALTQKADMPGGARQKAYSFAIGPFGYLGGGVSAGGGGVTNFAQYDPASDAWRSLEAPMIDTTRGEINGAATFTIGNFAYLTCGQQGFAPLKETWRFDPTGNGSWTNLNADMSNTWRFGTTGFALNGKGYAGWGVAPPFTYLNDLWSYDTAQNKWTQVQVTPQPGMRGWASAAVAGNMAFFGFGANEAANSYFNDLWSVTLGAPPPPNAVALTAANGGVAIYPNPTTTFIRFVLPAGRAKVQISNSLGIALLHFDASDGEAIDVSALAPGLYRAEIVLGSERVVSLFVKQ